MTHNRQIKVCFETQRAYPLFNPEIDSVFGGAEVDLYHLATELAKDPAFDVTFVVGDYHQPPVENRQGVTLIKSVDINKNFLLSGRRLWRAFHRADADIYLRKGMSLGATLAAIFCRRRHRIFVFRNSNSAECDGTHLQRQPLRAPLYRWTFRHATQVVVQNDTDATNLGQTTGVTALVIRNGHQLPAVVDNDRRDTILWVGRSTAIKSPQRFLDLASKFPQESFTMICPRAVDDQAYHQLTARADEIPNLKFIPAVPFHEIDGYFQRAKVFVNTSDEEGFPNTFIQACKAATGILSFKVNPDDFLNQHHCGLCAEGNEKQFTDMLRQLLDPARAADYAANGRRYAEAHHDITKIVEQYKALFRNLIDQSQST